ncbi:MAG: SDR family oxidoreductase [Dongiaceae bacterium]
MSEHIRLFVFGLGYSAGRFALAMRGKAEWIGGTVQTIEKAVALAAEPAVRPYAFDGTSPGVGIAEAVKVATHVLISAPPGESGDPVLQHHRATILAAPGLKWIGYLSTVGVYGDYAGAWVSEATTPHPKSERAIRRLAAEQAWGAIATERDVPLAIFRIAGIYGPARNAFVNLAEGRAHRIVKAGQVFNRIHVDDIVAALLAALDGNAAGIFNLADDEPTPPQDVVAFAARLMGVDPPLEMPFDKADLSPMARSFYGENKRVSNKRLRQELGVALRYPTYREGLSAMWQDGTWR